MIDEKFVEELYNELDKKYFDSHIGCIKILSSKYFNFIDLKPFDDSERLDILSSIMKVSNKFGEFNIFSDRGKITKLLSLGLDINHLISDTASYSEHYSSENFEIKKYDVDFKNELLFGVCLEDKDVLPYIVELINSEDNRISADDFYYKNFSQYVMNLEDVKYETWKSFVRPILEKEYGFQIVTKN